MKSKLISLIFCASIGTLCSCSSENEEIKTSSLRIVTDIATRSVIESTEFEVGNTIGLFIPDYGTANIRARATYDYEWYLQQEIPLTETPTPVYAYYPYTDDYNNQTIEVNIVPDVVVTGQADYLYGKSQEDVSAISPKAFILFNHALARITLSIKYNGNDSSHNVLSNVCLQNVGDNKVIYVTGKMDIVTGKISCDQTGYISLDTNYILNRGTTHSFDMLVIPTTMNTEGMAELVFTINDSEYLKKYTIKMPAANWEAGKQYTYPISLNINK